MKALLRIESTLESTQEHQFNWTDALIELFLMSFYHLVTVGITILVRLVLVKPLLPSFLKLVTLLSSPGIISNQALHVMLFTLHFSIIYCLVGVCLQLALNRYLYHPFGYTSPDDHKIISSSHIYSLAIQTLIIFGCAIAFTIQLDLDLESERIYSMSRNQMYGLIVAISLCIKITCWIVWQYSRVALEFVINQINIFFEGKKDTVAIVDHPQYLIVFQRQMMTNFQSPSRRQDGHRLGVLEQVQEAMPIKMENSQEVDDTLVVTKIESTSPKQMYSHEELIRMRDQQ